MINIISCSPESIDKEAINIRIINQHPILKDHDRQLIVKTNNIFNKRIALYNDPGDGCNSYLCENDTSFILTDCNGEWYSIDKLSGEIEDIGWRWGELPNDSIVGVFEYVNGKRYYELSKEFDFTFKYKDPNIQ